VRAELRLGRSKSPNDASSYKAAGTHAVDEKGNLDTIEFINIAKDDALAYPAKVHRNYPSTVNAQMMDTIRPFTLKSAEVCNTLLDALNDRLDLPKGKLGELHRVEDLSNCQSRCTKSPPARGATTEKPSLGAHTDFGSLVSAY
jgi:isopenicillin N synthase-like dioxygenase